MSTKRSTISLSYRERQDCQQSARSHRPLNSLQNLYEQLNSKVRQLQKQMKTKVNRNEFMSNLSTKLSISELASLNFSAIGQRHACQMQIKENVNPNNNSQAQQREELYEKLSRQIGQLEARIGCIDYSKEIQLIRDRQEMLESRYEVQKGDIVRLGEQMARHEDAFKQSLVEVEAYIYRKAERTEIEKLFTLNELLVIQIEQAKQKIQQASKQINTKLFNFSSQNQNLYNNYVRHVENRCNDLSHNLQSQISQKSQQIDRILTILQTKQVHKEADNSYYSTGLRDLQDRIAKQQQALKQEITRINILELKESHVNRAVKDVDQFRNQIQVFSLDIMGLHERAMQVSVNVKEFFETRMAEVRGQQESKFSREIQMTCQEIMKKVIDLTADLVTGEHVEGIVGPIKQKNRHLQQNLLECTKKLQFLDRKQRQIQQNLQEQIEKNEQRLSNLGKQLTQYITHKQFQDQATKYIKIDELKQIGREIDQKMSSELQKIVTEQDKINQVICSENIMGKWFWSNSVTKGGNLVLWDRQVVNTLPQNFKWNKAQPVILITKGGYYRIELGFYSKKKPTVQIIINGQTIVSAVNNSSYVLHHSSGKLKDVSNSEIAGLTYIDYLLLPDEARIGISYIGDFTGEGFFSVHRI